MARRQPYEHTNTPPVPEPETDLNNDNKIWLSDITQPAEKELEVHLEEPEVVSATEEKPKSDQVVEAKPEPEPVREDPKPSADDEAYKRLKAQLDRERQARESDRERLRQLELDRTQAQERLRQEQERYYAAQREQLDAQEIALDNAISHLENQAAQAKREISRALSEGDYDGSAAAYEVLADAKANLSRLKDGKQAIESQKKAPAPKPEEPQQQAQPQPNSLYDRIESYIQQPGHSLRVQQFLRDHYDDLFADFDSGANRLSRLLGGHYLAKSDGVVEGSDGYFDRLSQHMGYTKAPDPEPVAAAPPPPPVKPSKHIPPSAPVSRGSNGSGNSPTSITLTPAQVQFCKDAGVSPQEYARNLLRAREGGKDPSYSGPRFTADLG